MAELELGTLGNASGTLSLSQFKSDGFRLHSAAEIRQLNAGVDYVFSGTTLGTFRFSAADDPKAENPGALTLHRAGSQSRLGGRDQYFPRRRQGRPAAAARPGSQAFRRRRERLPDFALRSAARPEEPAGRPAAGPVRAQRGHLREHRPGRGRRPCEREPRARRRRRGTAAQRGRGRAADAGRPAELRAGLGGALGQRADRPAGEDHRVRPVRAAAVVAPAGAAPQRRRAVRLGPLRRDRPSSLRRSGQQRGPDQQRSQRERRARAGRSATGSPPTSTCRPRSRRRPPPSW